MASPLVRRFSRVGDESTSQEADLVDLVWRLMKDAELYSLVDLANLSGQPTDALFPVLEFLTRHSFMKQVTKCELLFRKGLNVAAPTTVFRILQAACAEAGPTAGFTDFVEKKQNKVGLT